MAFREYNLISTSLGTWCSILLLTDKYHFDIIKKFAFNDIVDLPGVEAKEKREIPHARSTGNIAATRLHESESLVGHLALLSLRLG
jgi:hypothetical protein